MAQAIEQPGWFYKYRDEVVYELPPGSVVTHCQLAPMVYYSDQERHQAIQRDPTVVWERIAEDFAEYLEEVGRRGVTQRRLRGLPSVGQHGHSAADIRTMIEALQAAARYGEQAHCTWVEQQRPRLQQACGMRSWPVQNYEYGVENGIQRGSFWVAQTAGSLALGPARLLDYDATNQHIQAQSVERPYGETADYLHFWLGVCDDPAQSYSLDTMLAWDPADYPRIA